MIFIKQIEQIEIKMTRQSLVTLTAELVQSAFINLCY